MRKTLIAIAALLLGSAILNLGSGLLGTALALRMAVAEFPVIVAGAITSGYYVGYWLGVFWAYRLLAGVGYIRAYAALASIFSATTLMLPFFVAPEPWGAVRFVHGFCIAGLAVCSESWLNERTVNENRGRIFSLYMIVIYIAQGGGQLLLLVPDSSGFGLFAISAALLSLALVPVAGTRRTVAPTPNPPSRLGLRDLWNVSPVGVAGALSSGLILGAFYGLMPYFAEEAGLGTAGTSRLMAAAIIGGLLFQWPLGRLSDRTDRRYVLLGVLLVTFLIGMVAAAALLVPGLAGHVPTMLLVLAPVLGAAIFTIYPLGAAHTNDSVDSAHVVSASAGLILAYGTGAIAGPAAAAVMMMAIGPAGLFVFFAMAGLLVAAFTLWRIGQRAAPPLEDREPFHAAARTAPPTAGIVPLAEPTTDNVTPPTEPGGAAPREATDWQI
ncbi:MAG: MFS transporter [Rhodospirillales bacterium]|nr:MFS transporter [Rhodospirillales bacterium]